MVTKNIFLCISVSIVLSLIEVIYYISTKLWQRHLTFDCSRDFPRNLLHCSTHTKAIWPRESRSISRMAGGAQGESGRLGFSGSGPGSRSQTLGSWHAADAQPATHTHARVRIQRPVAHTQWHNPPQRHAPADNTHVNINVKHTKAVREMLKVEAVGTRWSRGWSLRRSIGNRGGVQPRNY